jgi:hypothetical protein
MPTYRIAANIGRKSTYFCVVTGVYIQAMKRSVVVAMLVRERLGLAGMARPRRVSSVPHSGDGRRIMPLM